MQISVTAFVGLDALRSYHCYYIWHFKNNSLKLNSFDDLLT